MGSVDKAEALCGMSGEEAALIMRGARKGDMAIRARGLLHSGALSPDDWNDADALEAAAAAAYEYANLLRSLSAGEWLRRRRDADAGASRLY